MSSKIFMLFAFLCFAQISYAQLMGRIMDRAKNKLERKIEEKIVEEISEEIARRAYRPVEKAIEDAARQMYQDSLNQGEAVDWEKLGESYAAFLNGLNKSANLPDQYHFDLTQEVEVMDYNKKRSYIRMYYSAKDPIIGMENTDDDNKKQLIVIDVQRDMVVLYTTEKNGNKTGQALPGVLGLSAAMSKNTAADYYTSINKTGKTKKIAGYECKEYTGESKEELMEIYTTEQFPVNLDKTMGPYLQKFAPAAYYENAQSVSGMLMQSENTRKDDPTKKFSWTTKKVNQKILEVKKSDYTFGNDSKE